MKIVHFYILATLVLLGNAVTTIVATKQQTAEYYTWKDSIRSEQIITQIKWNQHLEKSRDFYRALYDSLDSKNNHKGINNGN